MNRVKIPLFALAGLLVGLAMVPAHAVVITDPTLHNGANPQAIDPRNRIKLWPTGARLTRAQMYELPGFGVIQDFDGFGNGTNGFHFTDPNRADVQISFSGGSTIGTIGGTGNSGSALNNADWVTSGSSGIRWTSNGNTVPTHTLTASIDFGKYVDGAFETADFPAVSAAGFTLTSHQARYDGISAVSVTYYFTDDVSPVTQTINAFSADQNIYALFFSYAAPEDTSITRIVINVDVKALADRNSAQIIIGIDDLGYTSAIPEPAHVALGVVGAAMAFAVYRRRRARS